MITITISQSNFEELAKLVVVPHEHYDGMNECPICDTPITEAATQKIRELASELDKARGCASHFEFALEACQEAAGFIPYDTALPAHIANVVKERNELRIRCIKMQEAIENVLNGGVNIPQLRSAISCS